MVINTVTAVASSMWNTLLDKMSVWQSPRFRTTWDLYVRGHSHKHVVIQSTVDTAAR